METVFWIVLCIAAVSVTCINNVWPNPYNSQLDTKKMTSKISDPLNSIEERKSCLPTISCIHAGGHCVKLNSDCDGVVDRYGCRGRKQKCKCCIPVTTSPAPTCPAAVTCTPCPSTYPQTIDDLATHELWLHILLQMDRPYENRFVYRGDNNYVYYLDNEKLSPDERSNPIIIPTMKDFTNGSQRFNKLLNYTKGRDLVPSTFDPDVRDAIDELHQLYVENSGVKGILKVAVNSKDYVNEFIHIYTLMHALAFDNETDGYSLPSFYEVFPEFFTDDCNDNVGDNCCEIKEYPQDLTEDEWKISYFREDAGFNDFHGSWHFYNPWKKNYIPLNHGELFFYFHNQIVARYDWERLSNGLERVKPLDDWTSEIPQNYNPPILTKTLKRCENMPSQVLHTKLSKYRINLEEDISNGVLMNKKGEYYSIRNEDGVKYLGCALERAGCGDSNPDRYFDMGVHNMGHVLISKINCDPPEPSPIPKKLFGVMKDKWTAVRDPTFFTWHKFIDELFQSYKDRLPEYNLKQLKMDDVEVGSVDVDYKEGSPLSPNELYSFNSKRKLTLWRDHQISTCIYQPHINHYPFRYNIIINNNKRDRSSLDVNVRIYMAPTIISSPSYEEQRTLWALMDRFDTTLTVGENIITRESCDSRITVPPPKSLRELSNIYGDADAFNEYRSKPETCQCGLPEHLLIPKGNSEGMPYQLFVYITPYNKNQGQPEHCKNLDCGDLCNREYTKCLHSDGEPMGFPFDRPLSKLGDGDDRIRDIQDLADKLPNAMLHNIKIVHNDELIDDRQCTN